jgi:TPR repeat protein
MYSQGLGVSEDPQEAVMHFNRAAELGYAPAQFALGICDRAHDSFRRAFVLSVLIADCKW